MKRSENKRGRSHDRPEESVCLEWKILQTLRRLSPEKREKALQLLPNVPGDLRRRDDDATPRPR